MIKLSSVAKIHVCLLHKVRFARGSRLLLIVSFFAQGPCSNAASITWTPAPGPQSQSTYHHLAILDWTDSFASDWSLLITAQMPLLIFPPGRTSKSACQHLLGQITTAIECTHRCYLVKISDYKPALTSLRLSLYWAQSSSSLPGFPWWFNSHHRSQGCRLLHFMSVLWQMESGRGIPRMNVC
jgi:hypothetical protein